MEVPDRAQCSYTECYCEENIYLLCKQIIERNPETPETSCVVVFISNVDKRIPLWCQTAGNSEDGFTIWDYHVILLLLNEERLTGRKLWVVYDLDTTLHFPTAFEEYFDSAIRDCSNFSEQFKRKFRLINGVDYLKLFSSNRSHMRTKSNGDTSKEWLSEPPSWLLIQNGSVEHSLPAFWTVETDSELLRDVSCVLTTAQMRERFSSRTR